MQLFQNISDCGPGVRTSRNYSVDRQVEQLTFLGKPLEGTHERETNATRNTG